MKNRMLAYSLVAVAAGFGAAAHGASPDLLRSETNRTVSVVTKSDGQQTTIVEDQTMPAGDVTSSAGRFAEGTEVAATGRVASKSDGSFILDRKDGQVRAKIGGQGDDRVSVGDMVTIYGRLARVPGDLTQVETEAVFDKATGGTYLTERGQERSDEMYKSGTPAKLSYHPL